MNSKRQAEDQIFRLLGRDWESLDLNVSTSEKARIPPEPTCHDSLLGLSASQAPSEESRNFHLSSGEDDRLTIYSTRVF